MFSTSRPRRTRTTSSTTTGGSATGEAAGQWGLDQMQSMIGKGPTAYEGPMPGSQGPNAAQYNQLGQYNVIKDQFLGPGGYEGQAQNIYGATGAMTPQQIAEANRRGGPDAGYRNPYEQQVIGGLKQDYQDALAMGNNNIGMGAHGANAFGGSRHGVAEGVMGSQAAQDFLQQAGQVRQQGYKDQMGWQRQDARDRAADIIAMNQANLGFGGMRMGAGDRMRDPSTGMTIAAGYGDWGRNLQDQRNLANMYGYNEFTRQQDWAPNMMQNYFGGVGSTPWQTSSTTTGTQTGQGKSNFEKTMGYGLMAKTIMTCIPEGTEIDTPDGRLAIEDIKVGTKVKGWHGGDTEVLQVHQYKEDPKQSRFYHITFDNGAEVDCCDMHRIYGKRAKDYKVGDSIKSNKIASITRYNGVVRSYDLLTEDPGYRIGGIPVDSMIEELAELTAVIKQAA